MENLWWNQVPEEAEDFCISSDFAVIADIDYAESEALTTYGIIGIKVWIYKGEIFSKEFNQETNKK